MAFQDFDQISQRRANERKQKLRKRITIAIVTIVLLLLLAGTAVGFFLYRNHQASKSNSKQEKQENKPKAAAANPPPQASVADKSVKSICASTDFKETCESSLLKAVKENITTSQPKDLLKAAMVIASDEIDKAIKQLNTLQFETPEKKAAFDDCMTLLNDARDELNSSASTVDGKDLSNISIKTPDVNNWLSAVLSYQQTCIDGMPEGEEKAALEKALNITKELSSNSLAIVSQVSSILSTFQIPQAKRRLMATKSNGPSLDADRFPSWMDQKDRRMLKAENPTYTPNVTVAKDGSTNFTTISAALAALPPTYEGRFVIYVREGIYEENVVITKQMVNLTIFGDGSQKSIITGSKNKVDGVPIFETATFVALGDGFIAQSIGFRNTAGPEKRQAVALRVQSDYSIFLNCRMEGFENTVYAQAHRQFYRSCYITGTVDIIFGDAAAVFQNCDIHVKKPMENQQNVIVAQGRVDKHQTTGIVLQNCQIFADDLLAAEKEKFRSYLGRPLREYSRTIVMETEIGDFIHPEGWVSNGDFALETLYFGEFENKGTGAQTTDRVKWPGYKVIDRDGALKFTVGTFIQGDTWLNDTDVPVRLGLSS